MDNEYKFVVVLNKKIDVGVAMNAASHMVAAMMNQATEDSVSKMSFKDYIDRDGNVHPTSGLPLIVLRAKNSNQIRAARAMAKDVGLLQVDFTESMTGDTYVEQMERTKQIPERELNYFGVCMFGSKAEIDPITSKFSLWRS